MFFHLNNHRFYDLFVYNCFQKYELIILIIIKNVHIFEKKLYFHFHSKNENNMNISVKYNLDILNLFRIIIYYFIII